MRGDRRHAERRDDRHQHDLAARHEEALETERETQYEGALDRRKLRAPAPLFTDDRQDRRTHKKAPEQHQADDGVGQQRADRRPRNPKVSTRRRECHAEKRSRLGREYQQEIEDNVKNAEKDVELRGRLDIARCPQQSARRHFQDDERNRQRKIEEIARGVRNDLGRGAEPPCNIGVNGKRQNHNCQGPRHRHREALPHQGTGAREILRADQVRHGHREADHGRPAHAEEKPSRGHEDADRGGSVGTEMADHRGVDVLHRNDGNLCHHCRQAEPQQKRELLARGELFAVAQRGEQFIGGLRAQCHAVETSRKERINQASFGKNC
ncbi:MAG: hypothetical protein ACFWTZ_10065 [Burkholderia sp.]